MGRDLEVKSTTKINSCAIATQSSHRININCLHCLPTDVTVKTVSEEYTPLHLAARFIPCDTTGSRVEPDSNEESIIKYLKECKVEVSLN